MFYSLSRGFNDFGDKGTAKFEVFTIENAKSALNVFYVGIATSLICTVLEVFPHFIQLMFILSAKIKCYLSTAFRNLIVQLHNFFMYFK